MTKQETFIYKMAKPCANACKDTPLFPSVKIAQMALETGWGRTIKDTANACFGIKAGKSWTGKVISFTTQEEIDGKRVTFSGTNQVYANRSEATKAGAHYQTLFRAYDSIEDSIKDHSRLLLTSKTYERVRQAKTPTEQCQMLQKCGYATASNYAAVLIKIIDQYDLTEFDW